MALRDIPLRVPAGWRIETNDYRRFDATDPSIHRYLKPGLLRAAHDARQRLLVVGWYPEDDEGGGWELALYDSATGARLRHRLTAWQDEITDLIEDLFAAVERGAI